MTGSIEASLVRLRAGAEAFSRLDALARAGLARETALAVAAVADRWVEAAVAFKTAGGSASPAILAEETATGPMASLRLLLVTARSLREIAALGAPRPAAPPRIVHRGGGDGSFVEIDVLPERWLADRAMVAGHRGVVRCANPGDVAVFERTWREECRDRPRRGGVAVVLGAGNVTGLSVADAVSQVFEHGRAAFVKLHPLHEPLLPVLRDALAPLAAAGMLELVVGGADVAGAAIASAVVTHVHLTGGEAAFEALVRGAGGVPAVAKPITCELGGVTPWIVVPGVYSAAQLAYQAEIVAGSILNNTSFNCIATKCVVTCGRWPQRQAFLELVSRRLAAAPPRRAWYPGATALWEQVTETRPPSDGTLPWVFRTGIDLEREPRWLEREWFVPVAAEVPLDAADMEAFCTGVSGLTRRLPGSLAASVTIPAALPARDRRRVDLLVEHLEYGTVAVNTWSALSYAFASLPWGGFPGGTLAEPASGIGFVHDPLLLPLVHNSILRAPLAVRSTPPWLPWHQHGAALARGVVDVYAAIARGRSGMGTLLRMLPQVLAG
jgi:hypothetical protein